MADATTMLKELSQPWQPGEFVKDAIRRVATMSGLSPSRAFDIWYGKARKVDETELAAIAEALNIRTKRAARNELQELKIRIAKLEALFARDSSDGDWSSADGRRGSLHLAGGARRASGGRG